MSEDLRVVPLPPSEWDETLRHIVDDMNGEPLNVHALMAHHPKLLEAWWNFRNYSVQGGDLGRRKGELVILRTAVHLKAWYEWASHVERAMACGIAADEIERVKHGARAPGWEESEALLIEAVDALVTERALSPGLQARLREHYSVRQVMDLMAITGMYLILGFMINTWDLDLDPRIAAKLPDGLTKEGFRSEFPPD
ncbi:carboxymuconolactone decarboxylase family protein [Microbaculum marinum]|uniref:Carboxymuconolactone decarboxylase family protein n=1 Tax=Microbaculum marinum TaxID=1764581 RepID=A0AAW9REE2_9HYPH